MYKIRKTCGVHHATIQKWFNAESDAESASLLESYHTLGVEGLIEPQDLVRREDNTLWQVLKADPKDYPSGWSVQNLVTTEDGTLSRGDEVKDLRDLNWIKHAWSTKDSGDNLPQSLLLLGESRSENSLTPESIVRATYASSCGRYDVVASLKQVADIVVANGSSWVSIDSANGLSVVFRQPEFATKKGVPDANLVVTYLTEHGAEDVRVDSARLKSHIQLFAEFEPKGVTRGDLEKILVGVGLPTWHPAAEAAALKMGYKIF